MDSLVGRLRATRIYDMKPIFFLLLLATSLTSGCAPDRSARLTAIGNYLCTQAAGGNAAAFTTSARLYPIWKQERVGKQYRSSPTKVSSCHVYTTR